LSRFLRDELQAEKVLDLDAVDFLGPAPLELLQGFDDGVHGQCDPRRRFGFDRSLDGAPKEYWHVSVIPPRSVIVDIGRNSAAILQELKGGTRTYQDVCGEMGYDWRKVLRQKAIEAKFINRLVDEYGVIGRQIAELAAETCQVVKTRINKEFLERMDGHCQRNCQ
jgi:hypothetical protein